MRIFDSEPFTVDVNRINDLCSELTVKGTAYCIWPNREGEGFELESVAPALSEYGCTGMGISLSWPATASTRAIILKAAERSILISKDDNSRGQHEEIRIFADSRDTVRFRFTGIPGKFNITELYENETEGYPDGGTGKDLSLVPKQFQLGITGPRGECNLPEDEGFRAIIPLANEILTIFPITEDPHILHLFGYAAGHDRGYPDFSPSEKWGGAAAFRDLVTELKSVGFKISLYMNARVMDASMQDAYPHLWESTLRDSRGTIYSEEYFGRRFLVMNPESPAWRDELYSQAMALKELGADMVQLDQVAGRAAAVAPGSPWGDGYADLIRKIRKQGLEVWIQGVSDFYPADCFEMTWKETEILEGGILRGGTPFGETDLGLLKALTERGFFKGTLLAPMDKRSLINAGEFRFRLDLMDKKGLLPLYGPDYIQRIKGYSLIL